MTTPRTEHDDAIHCGAGRLGLAASPSFALMAWLAACDGPRMALCGGTALAPMHSMAVMYWLMSVFHAAPWLRLAAAQLQRFTRSATPTEGD